MSEDPQSPLVTSAVVLDTNVFVAAGFNRRSSSARILQQVRRGDLTMVWNDDTRRETEHILKKIPPLSWRDAEELFRDDARYDGKTYPERFGHISDPDDRKFAALSAAAGAVLISNDDHLLDHRDSAGVDVLTPGEFWRQRQGSRSDDE